MKTLALLTSVLVVVFLAYPIKVDAQKRKATQPKQTFVLDENRAKALIGQAPQMKTLQIPWENIAPLMARSTSADTGTTLGRLIEANLVRQTVSVLTYPSITGTWASPPGFRIMTMQLHMDENSNVITGRCEFKWGEGLDHPMGKNGGGTRGNVTGTVTPDGSVVFTDVCWSEGGTQDKYQYSESGTTAYLRSVEDTSYLPAWKLTGTASGKVGVKWYEYTFTPAVTITKSGQRVLVEGGRYLIGDVSNLRLVTETMASANFTWQAQLNLLGSILSGGTRPSGNGNAQFAKKPDGSWVLQVESLKLICSTC